MGIVGVLATGCGGGVSLDAWAEEAEPICADLADELADAPADEVEDLLDDAVDDLEALAAPGGEDGELVADAIDALFDAVLASVEQLDVDPGDDALAALDDATRPADVDDELELLDETGADDCVDAAEDGAVGARAELAASVDALEDLADLRVGDCVVLDPDLAAADCDDADAEILQIALEEPDCPDEADVTQTIERTEDDVTVTLGLCLQSLENPDDTDNFLDVGSCAEVIEQADGDFIVNELPCNDGDVTHEIVEGVQTSADCLDGEIAFATSDDEEAEFGHLFWCADPL